ncbi:MAG: hypothetical protein IKW62_03390 [Clostridia bacterium]|nr:hypothetical protein [Clostridia bacterium]
MIIDVTGVVLIPGNNGNDCPGNGEHFDECGNWMGICCDECDYMMCCLPEHSMSKCIECNYLECPHARKKRS